MKLKMRDLRTERRRLLRTKGSLEQLSCDLKLRLANALVDLEEEEDEGSASVHSSPLEKESGPASSVKAKSWIPFR